MMHDRVLVLYIWFWAAATIVHHCETWSLKHDSTTTDISSESPCSSIEYNTNNESSSEYGTSEYTTTEISSTSPPSSTDYITITSSSPTSFSTSMSYANSESSSEYSSTSEYSSSSEYSSTSEAYISTTESLHSSTVYSQEYECDMSDMPIIVDSRQSYNVTLDGILNIARGEFSKQKYFGRIQSYTSNIQRVRKYDVDIKDTKLRFSRLKLKYSQKTSPHLIHCEFSQYLKMKIPLHSNHWEIMGNIYMGDDYGWYSIGIGTFKVIIEDLAMSITRERFSYEIIRKIEYGSITVETKLLNEHEHLLSTVKEATVEVKQQIEESLKSTPRFEYDSSQWYLDQIQSSKTSFNFCVKDYFNYYRLSQAVQFLTLPQNGEFYYVINDYSFNSIGSVDLQMSKLSINGLSNFKSYTLAIYSNLNHSFSLEINDLSGYVDWTYITHGKSSIVVKNTEKFKMESISLEGNNNGLTDISFSPTLQCVKSEDRFTSFATTILTKKMEDIIRSSLNDTIIWCLNQPVETASERFYS